MWFLWAISLTAISAFFTVRSVRLRRRLAPAVEAHRRRLESSDVTDRGSDPTSASEDLSGLGAALPPDWHEANGPNGVYYYNTRTQETSWTRPVPPPTVVCTLWPVVVSICVLAEGTLGWITGCAWTNAVESFWPSLPMYPSLPILISDLGATTAVTLLSTVWLIYCADDPTKYTDEQKEDREAVERYFITNAMSFFVGWCYVVSCRDLVTMASDAFGKHGGHWGFAGELAVVILFGPVLTAVLVYVKSVLLARYARLAPKRAQTEPSNAEARSDAAAWANMGSSDTLPAAVDSNQDAPSAPAELPPRHAFYGVAGAPPVSSHIFNTITAGVPPVVVAAPSREELPVARALDPMLMFEPVIAVRPVAVYVSDQSVRPLLPPVVRRSNSGPATELGRCCADRMGPLLGGARRPDTP